MNYSSNKVLGKFGFGVGVGLGSAAALLCGGLVGGWLLSESCFTLKWDYAQFQVTLAINRAPCTDLANLSKANGS